MHAPPADSFTFEPLFIALTVVAAVLYVRHVRTAGAGRRLLFGLGLACIVIPLNSPLETIAVHYLLLAHLAQNAISADIAPPLLILGLTAQAREALERVGGRLLQGLTSHPIAMALWLASWYGIHLGVVYDFMLRHPLLLNLEHGILIGAGLIFWWPVLSGTSRSLAAPAGLLYLFIAFATSMFLGFALTFLPSFYEYYQHTPRLWGLTPDSDQNIGGALMTGEQSAVFVAGLCWIFFRLLDEDQDVETDSG